MAVELVYIGSEEKFERFYAGDRQERREKDFNSSHFLLGLYRLILGILVSLVYWERLSYFYKPKYNVRLILSRNVFDYGF